MKKVLSLIYINIAFCAVLSAQPETTTPFLRRLNQATFINPAFIPQYKTSIGLPLPGVSNFYLNANLRGVDLKSITDATDNNVLSLRKLNENINTDAFGLNLFIHQDIFHVCFPVGKFQLGINLSTRVNSFVEIDKDFLNFAANGNYDFIGQKADFTGMSVYANAYNEFGISLAREFERYTVGARIKYLAGIANVGTDNLSASFTTGLNAYDPIRVQVGGEFKTAGPIPYLMDSINGQKATDEQKKPAINASTFTDNVGSAIDLGFTYWVTPRLNVHASIIDLGFINWKVNPHIYRFENVDVTFGGLTYEQLENADVRDAYVDSLTSLIKDANIDQKSYISWLPSRYFLGADYDLTLRDKVGVMLQAQYFNSQLRPGFTMAYSRKVGTNWDITTNYSYFNGSFANIGLGTAVKWGASQIFFVQDNILAALLPLTTRNVYFRLGFNLVWGEPNSRPTRID